jgi:signal transduction histidine kinase
MVLGVVSDFSDRSRVEMLKNEFVATVSHELRTPLTSIAGALGLLVGNAGGTLPGPAARLIAIAHANCQRLVRLVNSILAMEKIESGKVVFVLQRVELHGVIKDAIEANQAFAEAHGVRMRLDAGSAAGEIRADPDWLVQVLTNLLSNAIKFSPPGEEVVVAVERRDSAFRISVQDHGRGIPDAFKPRIFEKFAQADASDAREKGGTGLGLSIVKQLVTRLGGHVGFDDVPGGGAIFHVELPGWQAESELASGLDAAPGVPVPA